MSHKKRISYFVSIDIQLNALSRIKKDKSLNQVVIDLNVGQSTLG